MNKLFFLTAAVIVMAISLTGCEQGGEKQGDSSTVLRIAGSTSMMPVSERLARTYEKNHPGVKIHIEGGDSSLGIRGAAKGIVDVGSVSRPLTEEESKMFKSYIITEDSISIVVNEKNPVKSLTITETREVFSGKINNWSQVGGLDKPITVIGREHGSGTYTVFEDTVMGNAAVDGRALVMTSTGAVLSTVVGDINSIGYVSSNYQAQGIRKLEIQSGGNRTFVLSRPLLYVMPENKAGLARDYLDFCTGEEGRKTISTLRENQ